MFKWAVISYQQSVVSILMFVEAEMSAQVWARTVLFMIAGVNVQIV